MDSKSIPNTFSWMTMGEYKFKVQLKHYLVLVTMVT